MKRAFAVILCAVIIFVSVPVSGFAKETMPVEESIMPVVFIDGFTGSSLYDGNYMAFPPFYDDISTDSIVKIVFALLLGLVTGNYSKLIKTAKETVPMLLGDMERLAVKPDGSSDYDISVYSQDASIMRSRTIGGRTGSRIAKEIGWENCFMFRHDWRLSLVDVASQLDAFIGQVLEITGAQSVAIFGYSQGGQVAATYLNYYGIKGEVGKVVFVNSPIAGTKLASSVLDKKQLSVSLPSILRLSVFLSGIDNNYEWLLKLVNLRFLNNALTAVLKDALFPIGLYWGGLWDMIPLEDYETLKSAYLDGEQQKWLIEKSDAYHYDVMANMTEIVSSARENGISVSALSCLDCGIATNREYNGDGIVDAHGSSGAYAVKWGKTLGRSYVPKRTVCADEEHNHISPDRSLDASCAILPENTWFLIGQGHCQYDADEYTVSLLTKLFTSNELTDVYADSAFPQFRYGAASENELYISFGERDAGYIGNGDLSVTVTNTSQYKSIELSSLRAGNAFCFAKIDSGTVLLPGKSETFEMKNCRGFKNNEAVEVKAVYKLVDEESSVLKSKALTYTAVVE